MASFARKPVNDREVDGPAIDLIFLARQSLGDRALEMDLLALFDRQAGHILDQIAGVSDLGEQKSRDLAHTLKGSARAIGAGRVAATAETFELCVGAASAPAACADLVRAVIEARGAIAELLGDR